MKILIIGATGFLSGTMVRFASAAGHEVFALSRGKRPATTPGVRYLTADRNDPAAFAAAIVPTPVFDLVVDCIGFTAQHAQQDLQTFFPANPAPRARHLVFISSDFACSPLDRPWMIDEAFDRFDTGAYGGGKRAAEEILLAATNAAKRPLPLTILRPGHIYGPGSLLGCLSRHGRDPELLARIERREPLRLVADGQFLQQPIFAEDLAAMAIACAGNSKTHGQVYFAPGADIVTSRRYYQIIGEILGTPAIIEEASVTELLKERPENRSFCCHRVYDRSKAKSHGLKLAGTPIETGLGCHVESLRTARQA